MTESYLQFIWLSKRLLETELRLTDGREVVIMDFGVFNANESGPDFKLGAVKIEGVTHYGHIEIHVRASDWYRHNHQNDVNYDQVILHVVFEWDRNVYIHGSAIPTLELKDHIDRSHFRQFQNRPNRLLRPDRLICRRELANVDPFHLANMKETALDAKLRAKQSLLQNRTPSDALYLLIASAFGCSVNKTAFQHLAEKVHYSQLKQLNRFQGERLLLSESGILQQQSNPGGKITLWNFKGTRPANSPLFRIRQFAQLMTFLDLDLFYIELSAEELVRHFRHKLAEFRRYSDIGISKSMMNQLLINAVAPFLYFLAELKEDERFFDVANDLLMDLPPEHNSIIEQWKSTGVAVQSAYDSQSLLALDRYYCSHKKCLSCSVGNAILKRVQ